MKERTTDYLELDGAEGEGGGQILRSALTLSMVTGRPFRLNNIRARRRRPGLGRQHLAAVNAAIKVCGAECVGAEPGSQTLEFRPGPVQAGEYRVVIGTAGSTTLVLQTLMPALWMASGRSILEVEGGTHNPMSPPVLFLEKAFLPLLRKMGARVDLEMLRAGFMPAGGGCVRAVLEPLETWIPLNMTERGPITKTKVRVDLAHLDEKIAHAEHQAVCHNLGWHDVPLSVHRHDQAACPGNTLHLLFEAPGITEVFTGFGEAGISSEKVARSVCQEARPYLNHDVPIGTRLADQLLLPMALAGSGQIRTLRPTSHILTNISVITKFLPVRFQVDRRENGTEIRVIAEGG